MSSQEKTALMKTLAEAWQESGMTQTRYAETNNLSVHTLKYWLYKRKKSRSAGFVQIRDLSFGQEFVIRYPNGIELKISSNTPTQVIRSLITL